MWFAVGILRYQKWFDGDVSGYHIKCGCTYLYIFGYFYQKVGEFKFLVTLATFCYIESL